MQRDDAIGRAAQFGAQRGTPAAAGRVDLQPLDLVEEVVDHHVADEVDAVGGVALAQQGLVAGGLGDEEQVGDGVGGQPVDFFGHAAVAAAQAGLDVDEHALQLLGRDGGGQRGVDIAHHQHAMGGMLGEFSLHGHHDPGGDLGLGAAAGLEAGVGFGDAQFLEEDAVHARVAVLAGVDQAMAHLPGPLAKCTDERGDLHEVGPGAGNQGDVDGGHVGQRGDGSVSVWRWWMGIRQGQGPGHMGSLPGSGRASAGEGGGRMGVSMATGEGGGRTHVAGTAAVVIAL